MSPAARPLRRLLGIATLTAASLAALSSAGPTAAMAQQSASAGNVTLRLTMPEGVTKAKGIITITARGIASGWAGNATVVAMAKRLQLAIVIVGGGDDLNDNSYPNRCASGEFNGIPDALKKLAMATNHPELANAPLIAMGHSHGGDYWNWFNACHPQRMALVFVHASGGVNYSAGSLKTPIIYELGMNDLIENGSKKPRAGMFVNRAKGAPMSLVLGAGEGHNNVTQQSLDMVMTLVEAIFKLRVPADADPATGPVQLNEINEMTGGFWVGDLYTKEIAPWSTFMGKKATTAFLPSEEIARKWKETGPALPASIVLPGDTCSWCGNPKDEPKASAAPPATAPPPSTPADGGAPPPGSQPPPSTPPPSTTPPSSYPDAGGGSTPPSTSPTTPSTPKPPSTPSTPVSAPSTSEASGCSVGVGAGGSGSSSLAGLWVIGMLGMVAVLRRRRRR